MALTAPTGLSTAQKKRLKYNDPTMDDVSGIPEAVATETDLSNVISDLASTAAGKGASCIGYEGGTTVQAQLAANTASITALEGGGSTGFAAETATTGGKLALFEGTDNGTNKVTMASPNSLAANRTITVPDADVTLADIATSKAAIDAAVSTTAGGAGNSGKLVELDGSGKVDGYSSANWSQIANHEALLGAVPSTSLGAPLHIKVAMASDNQDVDLSLANGQLTAGTWEVLDFYVVLRGAGSSADYVRLYKNGNGGTAISDQIWINFGVDNQVFRASRLDDAYGSVVTGSGDRFTVTKRDGGDAPAVDAHIYLRKVA